MCVDCLIKHIPMPSTFPPWTPATEIDATKEVPAESLPIGVKLELLPAPSSSSSRSTSGDICNEDHMGDTCESEDIAYSPNSQRKVILRMLSIWQQVRKRRRRRREPMSDNSSPSSINEMHLVLLRLLCEPFSLPLFSEQRGRMATCSFCTIPHTESKGGQY